MKRRLFQLTLFFFLGAVVNVAVAWVLAVTVNVFDGDQPAQWRQIRRPQEFFWQGQSQYRVGGVWIAARHVRTSNSDSRADIGEYDRNDAVPGWSGFGEPTAEFSNHEASAVWRWGDGRGWPFLCLWTETERYNVMNSGLEILPVQWGIETNLPEWGGGNRHNMGPRVLPLHPIWPGFAINTIFYAAVLWLFTLGPFTARRMIRRKRGLCTKCGYDLRNVEHEVCPECGSELSARTES